jgi:radical SAM protein with 4Fe4S-binding SPASM domain
VGPGRWRVTADLVEESVAWFGDGDEFTIDVPRATFPTVSHSGDAQLFQVIKIETHNACNRHCWFCKFGQDRRDDRFVQLDWETIRRIVGNLGDLDYRGRISWYDINEPLVDKRIVEIVALTRQQCPNAFLSLATNGDLLTPDLYGRLKEAGLHALGVTAYDDETLSKVSRFADDRMTLIDMRDAGPGQLENRGGNVQRNAEVFQAQQWLFADQSCERPSVMMVVKASGLVALCCADMYGDVVMGDVREQRLEEIWRNDRFEHYRRSLAASGRRGLKLCEHCSYSGQGVRPFFPLADGV